MRDHAKNKVQQDKLIEVKERQHFAPTPQLFNVRSGKTSDPEAIQRQPTVSGQVDYSEDTIIYGDGDNFPLRLAQAVEGSPAAAACIGTISKFIKGAGFSDKDLMNLKMNKTGQTLWDIHCAISSSLALFEGFALNFKYNEVNKITNVYVMGFENIRFVKPIEGSSEIENVKHNPYFGTFEFHKQFTTEYPLFNLENVGKQIKELGTNFKGQVYYYGTTKPTYRFYPVPDYWSCKKWMHVDAKIQEFHAENLDNGFFQSVLMNIIGNPAAASSNPKYQKEVTGTDGTIRKESTKTIGDEFADNMSANFSGANKAGNVLVMWAQNKDSIVDVKAFPNNTNSDLFVTIQNLTTKNVTIATRVPAILANIHEGVSLGSDGDTMQKAIELMQSNVTENHNTLENLYNNIIIPNFQPEKGKTVKGIIKIVHFNPISREVTIEDKFWEVLTPEEKRDFIRTNLPTVNLIETPVATTQTVVDPNNPDQTIEMPAQQPNEALQSINIKQLDRIQKIVSRYNIGTIDAANAKALTYDQAKQFLLSYGLTESDIDAWLIKPDEL